MARMSWFRLWYAGRLSKWSHLFYTEYVEGHGNIAACGLNPYDQAQMPDHSMIAFNPDDSQERRCPKCKAAVMLDIKQEGQAA